MAQFNKKQFCEALRDMQNFVDCRDETDRLYQKYNINADAYGGHEYLDAMFCSSECALESVGFIEREV